MTRGNAGDSAAGDTRGISGDSVSASDRIDIDPTTGGTPPGRETGSTVTREPTSRGNPPERFPPTTLDTTGRPHRCGGTRLRRADTGRVNTEGTTGSTPRPSTVGTAPDLGSSGSTESTSGRIPREPFPTTALGTSGGTDRSDATGPRTMGATDGINVDTATAGTLVRVAPVRRPTARDAERAFNGGVTDAAVGREPRVPGINEPVTRDGGTVRVAVGNAALGDRPTLERPGAARARVGRVEPEARRIERGEGDNVVTAVVEFALRPDAGDKASAPDTERFDARGDEMGAEDDHENVGEAPRTEGARDGVPDGDPVNDGNAGGGAGTARIAAPVGGVGPKVPAALPDWNQVGAADRTVRSGVAFLDPGPATGVDVNGGVACVA